MVEQHRMRSRVLLPFLLISIAFPVFGQSTEPQRSPAQKPLKHSISITLGLTYPQSRSGLTAFWNQGPSEAMAFFVNVSRSVGLGVGFEIALLEFDEPAFRETFPAVEIQRRDIVISHVYVGAKVNIMPTMRTTPYLQATLGVSRMTEALYRKVIDGVRVTYYYVGGSTRLTGGLAAGVNIYLNRALALEFEGRAIYAHNDPDFGIAASARAGFRFNF